jgi:hypothetical protein
MGLFSIFLLSGHESLGPDLNSSCFGGQPGKPTGKSPHASFGGARLSLSEKIFFFSE